METPNSTQFKNIIFGNLLFGISSIDEKSIHTDFLSFDKQRKEGNEPDAEERIYVGDKLYSVSYDAEAETIYVGRKSRGSVKGVMTMSEIKDILATKLSYQTGEVLSEDELNSLVLDIRKYYKKMVIDGETESMIFVKDKSELTKYLMFWMEKEGAAIRHIHNFRVYEYRIGSIAFHRPIEKICVAEFQIYFSFGCECHAYDPDVFNITHAF